MPTINIFELFRDAMLKCCQRESLTENELKKLRESLKPIQRGFGNSEAIDYSNTLTRLAYMLSYAPKHAVVWREYLSARYPEFHSATTLNSIGTGCGAEVIGVMESFRGLGDTQPICWRCFDTEAGWDQQLKVAFEMYVERCGINHKLEFVSKIGDLHIGSPAVGSMVLSEIRRKGDCAQFVRDLRKLTPTGAWFLDIPKCTDPSGGERFLTEFFPVGTFTFESVSKMAGEIQNTVCLEIDACKPHWTCADIRKRPSMSMYFLRWIR